MQAHDVIETERLSLRPLAAAHAMSLHEIFADPIAMRFWHTPPHTRLDQTLAMVDNLVRRQARAWVLTLRGESEAVGLVYYLGNPGLPGLGYILSRRRWGNGLMAEAVRGALSFGFGALGLDRVELWIDSRNTASQRVAERSGFRCRAAFRQKYEHETASHENLVYGQHLADWRADASNNSTRPTRAYSLQPVLAVTDVRTTAGYYRNKLGFEIAFLWGEPPTYGGVSLNEWTATGVHIHLSRTDNPLPSDGLSLYLNVGPNLDELLQLYKSRGVAVMSDIARQPWGMREFTIRDCNGYCLRFGTPG